MSFGEQAHNLCWVYTWEYKRRTFNLQNRDLCRDGKWNIPDGEIIVKTISDQGGYLQATAPKRDFFFLPFNSGKLIKALLEKNDLCRRCS